MKRRLLYLCNAIDEVTRAERSVDTDSPAATQKVIQVSGALRQVGVDALVVSMGRGRQRGSGRWYPATIRRVNGVPFIYAVFWDVPVLTHLVSMWSMLKLTARLKGRRNTTDTAVLAYNRLAFYWPALELARLCGLRSFLDMEDGDIASEGSLGRKLLKRLMQWRLDELCRDGALLAASVLRHQYRGGKAICCYGVAYASEAVVTPQRQWRSPLLFHLGGTLQQNTGALLFAEAIRHLRALNQSACSELEVLVTGKGTAMPILEVLASEPGYPRIHLLGSVSRTQYIDTLDRAHVGMALKLPSSDLADTTFPSKVIEIASRGMLLLTTRVSDVPMLFQDDGAAYLDEESPQALATLMLKLAENPGALVVLAERGQCHVRRACSAEKVGARLSEFFFERTATAS